MAAHRIRTTLCLIPLLAALAGCEDQYKPSAMYLASTPACSTWLDGSRFDLPQRNAVFAVMPTMIDATTVELNLTYLLPRGKDVKYSSLRFELTTPHGPVVARGVVSYVDRVATGSAKKEVERLDGLPVLLRADASSGETIYRVRVRFSGALPERFDLTPPTMLVNNKPYPVRTFTYRRFSEKNNAYGLCS
jgi:hypothetical protein